MPRNRRTAKKRNGETIGGRGSRNDLEGFAGRLTFLRAAVCCVVALAEPRPSVCHVHECRNIKEARFGSLSECRGPARLTQRYCGITSLTKAGVPANLSERSGASPHQSTTPLRRFALSPDPASR
jgi:hypothetical protein